MQDKKQSMKKDKKFKGLPYIDFKNNWEKEFDEPKGMFYEMNMGGGYIMEFPRKQELKSFIRQHKLEWEIEAGKLGQN